MKQLNEADAEQYRANAGVQDQGYRYPGNLDLRPWSNAHKYLLGKLLGLAHNSKMNASKRHEGWRSSELAMTAYTQPTTRDMELAQAMSERGEKTITPVVYPYSLAIGETLISWLVAALMASPIFSYEGFGPEDTPADLLLTKLVEHQIAKSKIALSLFGFLRDCITYGIGVAAPRWKVINGWKFVQGTRTREVEYGVTFEGNELLNVSPYDYLPDPTCSAERYQDSSYIGWTLLQKYSELLRIEESSKALFNCRYIPRYGVGTSALSSDANSMRTAAAGGMVRNQVSGSRLVDTATEVNITKICVDLIPREWGLSSLEIPQKWIFAIAGDNLIIEARPHNLIHGQYPVCVSAPEGDGYSSLPMSRLELMRGSQSLVDWLLNAHMLNVKHQVNNVLIVDPWTINIDDILNPRSGGEGVIRTTRKVWGGTNLANHVHQLPISDVTRNHVNDIHNLTALMDQMSGSNQAAMGVLRQGGPERLTSAEASNARMGGAIRLEKVASTVAAGGWRDIGTQIACNTQQFMTQPYYIRLIGEWVHRLARDFGINMAGQTHVRVDPFTLSLQFDAIVRDGTVPNPSNSQLWLGFLDLLGRMPQLAQSFDSVKVASHLIRSQGIKNVDDFRTNVSYQSNEQIAQQVQAGNLVPYQQSEAMVQ